MRKSAFGRTNLFLATSDSIFREICCSASSSARHADASIFHPHMGNSALKCTEGTVCWHCCHPFDVERAMRLPRIFDPTDNIYHVYGWFCSANCAKAYILEHSTFDRGYQMNIFVRMLREVYEITESVTESPPRISLRMFGGPFDIESFRSHTGSKHHLVTPPFVSYSMLIEERQGGFDGRTDVQDTASSSVQPAGGYRGTVRGLRRPDNRKQLLENGEGISAEPGPVLYEQFLREHGDGAVEHRAENLQTTNKKVKVVAAGGGSGLAKFARDDA